MLSLHFKKHLICSSDESESSRSDSATVKICIGTTEKAVAQSKLQALLAQLEKGGEFGTPEHNRKIR